MLCKPVPAFLCLRFYDPVHLIFGFGPVDHAGETGGHLRFECDGFGMDVRSFRKCSLRALSVGCERPEGDVAGLIDAVDRMFFIKLAAEIPFGVEHDPFFAVEF